MNEYDVIIIGSGHNGLTCAGYLAKAGLRVLVLEARSVVGGGCATGEVAAPGFRHNYHSNFHGLIHMGPVYRDLELDRYGARYIWPENQFAHVFPDDHSLVLSRSLETTVQNISRYSRRDARTFRELALNYRELLTDLLIPGMFSSPRTPGADLADIEALPDGVELVRHMLTTPNHLARELFESPEVQTWLGFWVAQLAGTGDVFGLGANYPVMLAGSLEPYGWALCEGGSNQLAQAMVKFLVAHGGEVRLDSPVREIQLVDQHARGVILDNGVKIPVDGILISNLDPKHTFFDLLDANQLPTTLHNAVSRWRYDTMSMFCMYLALDRPMYWRASAQNPDLERTLAVSVCESLDVLDDNASECRLGIPPRQPGLFTVHPSRFEPSLAPPGKEACFVEQIAPYEIRDGGALAWDDFREEYATVVLDRWRGYLDSGLEPANIVGTYIASPIDIERTMPSMRHGDWNHGEMTQDQLGAFRPFYEFRPYTAGLENVYLCGASTHPGGSIGGACGYNAANVIAADLNIKPWWV